ncbi:MAG: hypothetical protein ABIG67_01085 [Pseudomonadota bacterium]
MARYDRGVPPGGTGKITLTIDTNRVMGMLMPELIIMIRGQISG